MTEYNDNTTEKNDRHIRQSKLSFALYAGAVIFTFALIWFWFSAGNLGLGGTARTPYKVIFVGKTASKSIEFWRTVEQGLHSAAVEFNVNLEIMNAADEGQIDENLQLFQNACEQHPDAIILAASDYYALAPAVEKATASGQKVIMMDSDVERRSKAQPLSLVATDNVKAGNELATFLGKQIKAESKVLVVSQQSGVATANQRYLGICQALKPRDITVGRIINAKGSKRIAFEETLESLRNENWDAVIALNEYTAEACAIAISTYKSELPVERHAELPMLVGIDCSKNLVPYLEDGTIMASLIQRPFNLGYLSVKTAVEAASGKEVPMRIDVDTKLITKNTLYTEENQKLLFPFSYN